MSMTWDSGGAIILSTVIGVVLVWIGGMISKHFGNNEQTASEAHDKIDELDKRIVALDLAQRDFKTHVAEHYAKLAVIEKMEGAILAAMLRLEQKIDKMKDQHNGSH